MSKQEAINKFYKTEQERIQKIRENKSHIHKFWETMKDKIHELEKQEIRFCIINMDFTQKPTLDCIIYRCCGNTEIIHQNVVQELENLILKKTEFEIVRWH